MSRKTSLQGNCLSLKGFSYLEPAVMRSARVVRHSATQRLVSKRSASRSSDQEVMRYLSRSQIFKDYEGAFSAAMGLPLNIRGSDSWSPSHHGKEDHDDSFASILARFNKGAVCLFEGSNQRLSRTGLDNAHRYLVCWTLRKCSAGLHR